ncbi:MAG: histidinol phosphatase [Actinobacteria bacterium]|nr:histidinol phosphatase [Actinomycetota bacterium]
MPFTVSNSCSISPTLVPERAPSAYAEPVSTPPAPSSSPPAQSVPYAADLELATGLADRADAISMARFLASDLRVETKPDLTPVTEADRAVEEELRRAIRLARPADIVVGEEFGGIDDSGLPAGRVWIIDPIDGTKNYVRGVPVWATLIALIEDGEPVVGLVSAPALGRRWWAAPEQGAWTQTHLRGHAAPPRQIHVSAVADLSDASFSYSDRVGWQHRTETGLDDLISIAWRTRAYSDFYSYMLLAEGAVDVAAEPELSAWDIAALIPIITQAGGTVTGFDGGPALTADGAYASNSLLHPAVTELLRS